MALESFYGGKQGVSPVIKARFKYINKEDQAYIDRLADGTTNLTAEEFIWLRDTNKLPDKFNSYKDYTYEQFKKGDVINSATTPPEKIDKEITWTEDLLKPFTMDECLRDVNYTDVWYGELCIIDTDSKYNPNNGKLYRRTLKQVDNRTARTEDTRYAEYIGQIVGPTGGTPKFDFGSLNTERQKAAGVAKTYDTDVTPINTDGWQYSYKQNNTNKMVTKPPNSYEEIAISEAGFNNNNQANIQMVPGKDGNNFHDTIRYTWCNVIRKDEEGKDQDTWIYLGFEIPYITYQYEHVLENYTYDEEAFYDRSTTPNDNPYHPFHKHYEFHIPRGARGIGPESIFVVGKDRKTRPTTLYAFDAITYDQTTDQYSVDNNKKLAANQPTEETYWVAKWRLYNSKMTTITDVYQYLGAYNDIASIVLNDGNNGRSQDGNVIVNYSDGSSITFTKALTWITAATLDTNGSTEANRNRTEYGNIKIEFNNDKIATIDEYLPLIRSITYNQAAGTITSKYANGTDNGLNITATGNLDYVNNLQIDARKTITENGQEVNNPDFGKVGRVSNITNNNNKPFNGLTNQISEIITQLPLVKNLRVDTINGHLYVTYADNPNTEIDLGLVKTTPVIGFATEIYPRGNNSPVRYSDPADVLADLNNGWTNNDQNPTIIINGNTGNKPGYIEVHGTDRSGGFIGAPIGTTAENEQTGLFYYNGELVNNTPIGWQFLGIFGGSGGGNSGIFVYDRTDIDPQTSQEKDVFEPTEDRSQPKFYFENEFRTQTVQNNSDIALPEIWTN